MLVLDISHNTQTDNLTMSFILLVLLLHHLVGDCVVAKHPDINVHNVHNVVPDINVDQKVTNQNFHWILRYHRSANRIVRGHPTNLTCVHWTLYQWYAIITKRYAIDHISACHIETSEVCNCLSYYRLKSACLLVDGRSETESL